MMSSKKYALQYFNQEDDSLFALITPDQWLEFANQYNIYVNQQNDEGSFTTYKLYYTGLLEGAHIVDYFDGLTYKINGKTFHEYEDLVKYINTLMDEA